MVSNISEFFNEEEEEEVVVATTAALSASDKYRIDEWLLSVDVQEMIHAQASCGHNSTTRPSIYAELFEEILRAHSPAARGARARGDSDYMTWAVDGLRPIASRLGHHFDAPWFRKIYVLAVVWMDWIDEHGDNFPCCGQQIAARRRRLGEAIALSLEEKIEDLYDQHFLEGGLPKKAYPVIEIQETAGDIPRGNGRGAKPKNVAKETGDFTLLIDMDHTFDGIDYGPRYYQISGNIRRALKRFDHFKPGPRFSAGAASMAIGRIINGSDNTTGHGGVIAPGALADEPKGVGKVSTSLLVKRKRA